MPKKVPDYSKSCIYKLVHKEDFDNVNCYVGSTTNFIQRKKRHKSSCSKEGTKKYNFKLYQHIRENGGWDNWVMIQIEPFSCGSKKELETQERRWIEYLKAKLNYYIPTRTSKEYYYDNRDELLEKLKQNYIDNKDKIVEKNKQYYIDNRDEFLENAKQYRIDNRDKILQKKKEKVICDNCGCEITKYYSAKHKRSQKCINFNSK